MTASSTSLAHSTLDLSGFWGIRALKGILNQLTARAEAAVDRSRLAALPRRYLDDVGMTAGERAAILGCEPVVRDPWTLITFERL